MDPNTLLELIVAHTRIRVTGLEGYLNGFTSTTYRLVDDLDEEHEIPVDEIELLEPIDEEAVAAYWAAVAEEERLAAEAVLITRVSNDLANMTNVAFAAVMADSRVVARLNP